MVHETFTVLPCNRDTTVGMEGCLERHILRSDATINRAVRTLWSRDPGTDAHADLADAQARWQAYRRAACTSEADAYAGGSLAPVAGAQCELRLTRQRAAELGRQLRLSAGG